MQPAVQWWNCKGYDENQVLLQSWLGFLIIILDNSISVVEIACLI